LTIAAIYSVAAAAPSVNSKMSRWTDDDTPRWKNLPQPASKYKNKSNFLVVEGLWTDIMNLFYYYLIDVRPMVRLSDFHPVAVNNPKKITRNPKKPTPAKRTRRPTPPTSMNDRP